MLAIVEKWLAWLASSWSKLFCQKRMPPAELLPARGGSSGASLPWSNRRLDRA